MSAILRPYQTDIVADVERHIAQGERKILLVAPTGSGKTVIASAIIAGCTRRMLVVAHRREIVNQTSDKLTARGIAHASSRPATRKSCGRWLRCRWLQSRRCMRGRSGRPPCSCR